MKVAGGNKMKIVINYPDFMLQDINLVFNWHGYSRTFVMKYADAIYVQNLDKAGLFKEKFKELGKKVEIISKVEELDENEDVLVGFRIGFSGTADLEQFNGIKIFHTMDYYLNAKKQYELLKELKADYVIGHCQLDKYSHFFGTYYPNYVGKVISLPFGYGSRFKSVVPFEKRINKAVGLGSINKVNDAMLKEEEVRECLEFFKNRQYQHEGRKYIQDNSVEFQDCVDAFFPTPERQKDFTYDAVEKLNSYKMFFNDAGMSNFPPARTYEGIACGCVMVAEENDIYGELGFEANINYIAFTKGDFQDMAEKIRYYMKHEEELVKMHVKSLELAKRYTHEKVAEHLYKEFKKVFAQGRKAETNCCMN